MSARRGRLALLLASLLDCATALHARGPLPNVASPNLASRRRTTCSPIAAVPRKLFSRTRLDFGSQDHSEHAFGLQGHILGLAPQADSYVLIWAAILLARRRALPLADLAFAIGFPAYLAVSNWVLFNANLGYERPYKPLLREGRGAWFKRYVLTYAIVGLLLPLPVIVFAPSAIAVAAAPHLFLTLVQCACEGLTSHKHFAAVLRLAVPIGFNIYRLGTIQTWLISALAAARASAGGVASSWAWASLTLAVANGAIWSYNLLVFLLLRVAPQYLDKSISATPTTFEWKFGLIPVKVRTAEEADVPASV